MLEVKLTDNEPYDNKCVIGLIETARRKVGAVGCEVKEMTANTGYNSHKLLGYFGRELDKMSTLVSVGGVEMFVMSK